MGLAIRDLVPSQEIEFSALQGKVVAVDTFNFLYQFLTTIRGRDGSLLTTTDGKVTSHLVGLFGRTLNFMQKGIKLVFVYDGKAPDLKTAERERRRALKESAEASYQVALKKKDVDAMKKYASRTTRLTSEMIEESKTLLRALGLPIVQAPSEGEAQTAYMARKGDVYAAVSQDFDSLLHGCPKLLRNFSLAGRKKTGKSLGTTIIKPEIIELNSVLNHNGIDQEQLIALSILVGTDFNIGGVKGIGPKNGLKLVKEYKKDFDGLFKSVQWDFPFSWQEVYDTITKMPMEDHYDLTWNPVNREKLQELLVEQYEFSAERVDRGLKGIMKEQQKRAQTSLGDF